MFLIPRQVGGVLGVMAVCCSVTSPPPWTLPAVTASHFPSADPTSPNLSSQDLSKAYCLPLLLKAEHMAEASHVPCVWGSAVGCGSYPSRAPLNVHSHPRAPTCIRADFKHPRPRPQPPHHACYSLSITLVTLTSGRSAELCEDGLPFFISQRVSFLPPVLCICHNHSSVLQSTKTCVSMICLNVIF